MLLALSQALKRSPRTGSGNLEPQLLLIVEGKVSELDTEAQAKGETIKYSDSLNGEITGRLKPTSPHPE